MPASCGVTRIVPETGLMKANADMHAETAKYAGTGTAK